MTFMVPVFKCKPPVVLSTPGDSWLSLRFYSNNLWFAIFRELYEAFVLWSFYNLMIGFFKSWGKLVDVLERKEERHAHMLFPLCCLRPTCRISIFRSW